MKFIYIVGAQCTGKTTLSEGLHEHIRNQRTRLGIAMLSETARDILSLHQYTKNDVRGGGQRCLDLQRLIFHSQLEKERALRMQSVDIVISDRCAIDPLAYAAFFCGMGAIEELIIECDRTELENQLRTSTVVLCEPVQEWLFDDGTRLMPLDMDEWHQMHFQFRDILDSFKIGYVVLPHTVTSLADRVEFVLSKCDAKVNIDGNTIDSQDPAVNNTLTT